MSETKKCKMCRSDIATDAKKCPYCKSLQIWIYHPFTLAAGVTVFYLIFILIFSMMFADMVKKGESFQNFKDKVVVSQSELEFGKRDNGSAVVVVVGKVQNQSKVKWEQVHFQVNCYNSENKLFDTKQSSDYDFVVPAGTTVPFKVSFAREFPEAEYKRHEVNVVDAKGDK